MPRTTTPMTVSLLEKLREFGVAESIFNRCAEQGLCTLDDLFNISEGVLRALGILKGPRVKIMSWVCSQKCRFELHLYSHGYATGPPVEFVSAVEFKEWVRVNTLPILEHPTYPHVLCSTLSEV